MSRCFRGGRFRGLRPRGRMTTPLLPTSLPLAVSENVRQRCARPLLADAAGGQVAQHLNDVDRRGQRDVGNRAGLLVGGGDVAGGKTVAFKDLAQR